MEVVAPVEHSIDLMPTSQSPNLLQAIPDLFSIISFPRDRAVVRLVDIGPKKE
jgi:hypothetical protein